MEKKKNFLWWVVFILLCIWQLPQLIVAIVMLPFMGRLTKVADRHFNFGFQGTKMSGGISLGPISFVSPYSASKQEVIAHEVDGHTVQSKILGPFYLFVIGLPSIFHAMKYDYRKSCYYDFWTESWANKCAKLGVTENCTLYFLENQKRA